MRLTHYIVVRRDLPFGDVCAQIAHAAGESFFMFRGSSVLEHPVLAGRSEVQSLPADPHFDPSQTVVVVLGARNEGRLERLARQLTEKQIAHVSIRETDGPWSGQLMAIGLVPGHRDALSPHVREFQMLKFDEAA